jgi:SAM-dependent methyltransferase
MTSRWLLAGLFFATLSTLLLETLDARLLSVLTWYHLSFFAVSLAMLGMAAGAVFVFLHPDRFSPATAPASVARTALVFAAAVPISHLFNLTIPFLPLSDFTVMEVVSVAVSTIVLAVPFVCSGIAVTAALTRCGGSIGRLYGADLVGAALGCLLVVPVLDRSNITSAVFFSGAAAAAAAACFYRFAGKRGAVSSGALCVVLAGAALFNTGSHEVLQVIYPKNQQLWLTNSLNTVARWNSHSYVIVQRPGETQAFLWGPGKGADRFHTRIAWLEIDGEAGTPITQWDGNPSSLEWVSYDVTTLPYYLRRGDVAVIGVGGGRDILAAIWGRNRSILGVDVNNIMIDLLEGSHRDFANIANRPEVTLVHDDGRAALTRTPKRFDIIQMSLVDTWAATGAGAFTLSENGLYTLDGWRIFLDRLKPGGVLSVSRWFDPSHASETSRLLSLGVAALLDRGVTDPLSQTLLVFRDRVATLMISNAPFTDADRQELTSVAGDKDFHVAVSPWTPDDGSLLSRIAHSRSRADLDRAVANPLFDYSPPTDGRPYYFNMLKPRAITAIGSLQRTGGVVAGNLRATVLLLVLLGIATLLVALIIVWPLVRAGRPPLGAGRFATTMGYFATIGFAYMLVQIGLLQRFAVYLGHPVYTLAIVLFSMLLFTGVGSLLSERVSLDRGRLWRAVPVAIAVVLFLIATVLPGVIAASVTASLVPRTLVVLLFAAPLSTLLGMCFPFGARLTSRTPEVIAWAWGINGAFGVLASILAVAISIWVGIDANFWLAAVLYLALSSPLAALVRWNRQAA